MLDKLLSTALTEIVAEIASVEAELGPAREALTAADKSDVEWWKAWEEAWWRINRGVGQRPIAAALESRLVREHETQRWQRSGNTSAYFHRQVVANLEWKLDDLLQAKNQGEKILAGHVAGSAFSTGPVVTTVAARTSERAAADSDVSVDTWTVPGPGRRTVQAPVDVAGE
ncbi:MAG: hypothetical protein EXQ95_13480 [Alphaproteobacteria bacterium]|nr:hypothetical protein [Alphaproteobacteria bacterium]